jgi:hypothetical protein
VLGDYLVSMGVINKCWACVGERGGVMDGYLPIFWRGVELFQHHFLDNVRQLFDLRWSSDIFDHINLEERHIKNVKYF